MISCILIRNLCHYLQSLPTLYTADSPCTECLLDTQVGCDGEADFYVEPLVLVMEEGISGMASYCICDVMTGSPTLASGDRIEEEIPDNPGVESVFCLLVELGTCLIKGIGSLHTSWIIPELHFFLSWCQVG